MTDDQFLGTPEFNYEQYEFVLDNYEDVEPERFEVLASEMMANIRNNQNVAHSKLTLSLIYSFVQYGIGEMEGLEA